MSRYNLPQHLELSRCPHCSVDKPNLGICVAQVVTSTHDNKFHRTWASYSCRRCGGVVTAHKLHSETGRKFDGYTPQTREIEEAIPERSKRYLKQAIDSIAAPSGCIMLCASSVDAMLKEKGLEVGSLYKRIDEAVSQQLITADVAQWAHEVRLDANDERHADVSADFPDEEGAKRAIDFVEALGEILFVLPARVRRALKSGIHKEPHSA